MEKKEAMKILKDFHDKSALFSVRTALHTIIPELNKSEDNMIKKELIKHLKDGVEGYMPAGDSEDYARWLAWLEKQDKEKSWKPSKEEMDVLYGLAYITNQYDEHKEEVITRLYQDLKREFFNGSSYENMFPTNTSTEDDVRRRSTIQVLEYARSLDVYNQYGKADIDKNIAWLEKQGKETSEKEFTFKALPRLLEMIEVSDRAKAYTEKLAVALDNEGYHTDAKIVRESIKIMNGEEVPMATMDEQKPADNIEPKFKVGDWIVWQNKCYKVNYNGCGYKLIDQNGLSTSLEYGTVDKSAHLWTIQDAKDGDVLASELCDSIILFRGIKYDNIDFYCDYDFSKIDIPGDRFTVNNGQHYGNVEDSKDFYPATKEQRDLLFQKMHEAGYTFDFEKKELKKIDQKSYGQRKECLDCQFNYVGECKGSCQMKRDEQKPNLYFKAKDWYVSKVDGKIYNAKFMEKTSTNQARKLEIEKAAMSATGILKQEEWFIKGAEWSDKNPSYISSEKQDEQKPQRMVSAEAKEALYDKPTDEEMKELLRTEYEKGRADTLSEMYVPTQISPEESLGVSSEKYMDIVDTLTQGGQKPAKWSLEDERVIAIINNALTESNTPPDDYDKVYDWLESIKQRIGG